MKIIVVGCGKVGLALVEQLLKDKHEITVIDKNSQRLKTALANHDVMTYAGDGTSYTTLRTAGIASADLMIAVMNSDEMNLLCSVIAKKAGNCKTIARVRNPVYTSEHDFLRRELDISMIFNPELTAAMKISRIFNFPYASKIEVFSKRMVELIHFKVKSDSKLCNLTLMDIRSKFSCNVLVCTVQRGEEVFIPTGNFMLQADDMVSIMGSRADTHEFFRAFGVGMKKLPDAMIVGGGKIGYYLAKSLIDSGIKVKIIDSDAARCEQLADELPEADIICGDGTDKNLIMEEGLLSTSGFAALTSIDEENILLSLYVRSKITSKVVTKVNRISYEDVIERLDLDTIVNPNIVSTELVAQFVRSMQHTMDCDIETYRTINDGKAEALEFVVKEGAKVIGIPLVELKRRNNVLISCIIRKNKVIIPGGQDTIEAGDSVIIVNTLKDIYNIDDILA
ncbi:MAG: Trk system potassium transporter TrkA [Lachnospiraceae bacterium]|nr:Trk system potassium transporter TrkA [Lachnospiraceae bacterium]